MLSVEELDFHKVVKGLPCFFRMPYHQPYILQKIGCLLKLATGLAVQWQILLCPEMHIHLVITFYLNTANEENVSKEGKCNFAPKNNYKLEEQSS